MILPPVLFAGLAATFWIGMQRDDPDALPSAIAGKPAPSLELTPLGDLPAFGDEALDAPGVKLVNFWASWCAPCRVEHPNLEVLAEEGVPIYGINYKDNPDNALSFLDELGNPYVAVAADVNGRTALDWGLYGVPETYVIDGDGQIVLRFAGPITQRVMDSQIRPALKEAAD
ncbi:DsbE family thiol:disulfide interchange protein [Tranquillimonas alkanivorans]|nr:DsbE family thiol:disulfide interchange protein [Tranquillimonas alkanivorans]